MAYSIFSETSEWFHTGLCPQIEQLDELPIPDRSLINFEKYRKFIGIAPVKNCITIQATRGCPYHCAYCHKIWPKNHIFRSAENIFQEIKTYYDIGITHFAIIDDIFNFNKQNSTAFFHLLIQNNLKIKLFFPSGLRGDILTRDYIDLMVAAGVAGFPLALETGSERLQKFMGKNLNLNRLKENLDYISQQYPELILELETMHGFPTETEQEAMQTLDFIKSIKWLHFPYINILRIYPNTEMELLALKNGISREKILRSVNLSWHLLPETLPFDNHFTIEYQTDFLNNYFLSKERLLKVLPNQIKVFTENELIQKYDSYLQADIKNMDDLFRVIGISEEEIDLKGNFQKEQTLLNINDKMNQLFSNKPVPDKDAFKILLIDFSQFFSSDERILYDVVEQPLGLMYLISTLNQKFKSAVQGKICKSRIDFDSFEELRNIVESFDPDLIGVRSLSFYKRMFHDGVAKIRSWGFNKPMIAGGPYPTSEYQTVLKDENIDLVVLGEGEMIFSQLVESILNSRGQLPDINTLKQIKGIAFFPYRLTLNRELAKQKEKELLYAFNHRKTEREYWQYVFTKPFNKSIFPYDYNPHEFMEDRVDSLNIQIPAQAIERLLNLSRHHIQSLLIILVSQLMLLLKRYTHSDDVTIGIPISYQGDENQLMNSLVPIRCVICDDMTFMELLDSVKSTVIEAFKYQNFPMTLLSDEMVPGNEKDDFPLFDVALVLNPLYQKAYLNNIKHHILFNATFSDGYLEMELEYNSNLYKKDTIIQIADHFSRLIDQSLSDVKAPIQGISMILEAERYTILNELNHTAFSYPDNQKIYRRFELQSQSSPDRIALVFEDQFIGYQYLNSLSNRVANYLIEDKGVQPGNLIGLYLNRSPEMMAAILGIMKAGCAD